MKIIFFLRSLSSLLLLIICFSAQAQMAVVENMDRDEVRANNLDLHKYAQAQRLEHYTDENGTFHPAEQPKGITTDALFPEEFRLESEDGRWPLITRQHRAKLADLGEDFLVGQVVGPQDFYLPVSTTSEVAKSAYYEAMRLAANAHMPQYRVQLDKALQADSNFFMAYVHKAMAANAPKTYEEVVKLAGKALSIDPAGLTKAERILRKLMEQWQKDPKSSVAKVMEELTAAYPETPQAFEWASTTAIFIDKDKPAGLAYAQKLVALRPDYAPVYNTLGYLYLAMDQKEQSKTAFENQIRLAPKEANGYDSMGEYYLTVKDYAKSAEFYDKAVALGMETSKAGAEKARELMKQ